MSNFVVHGECNYTSQRKVISQTFSHELEIVRELYSNSHDANASNILVFPRVGANQSLLIWVDDGNGMDDHPLTAVDVKDCRGRAKTTLESYFHIGNSTRRPGHGVGQFCHGQKLVLHQADEMFAMVTRTSAMAPHECWAVSEGNVFDALENGEGLNLRKVSLDDAYKDIKTRLAAVESPSLYQDFTDAFTSAMQLFRAMKSKTGTLQVFVASATPLHTKGILETSPGGRRSWRKPPKFSKLIQNNNVERTALVGCLRFSTRHGSTLVQFPSKFNSNARSLEQVVAHCPNPKLYEAALRRASLTVFTREVPQGHPVPYGFPYIDMLTTPSVGESTSTGSLRSRTSLWARFGPRLINAPTQVAIVMLVIDSPAQRLMDWEWLQRGNDRRCGIPMQRFSGVLISVQGVPILRENQRIDELFEALPHGGESPLDSEVHSLFKVMLAATKETNALLIINFNQIGLRTDRNDLSPEAYDALHKDKDFLYGLASTFQEFYTEGGHRKAHNAVLHEVMRIRNEGKKQADEKCLNEYCDVRSNDTLEGKRMRLVTNMDAPTKVQCLISIASEDVCMPKDGHEKQLEHLYAHYGTIVRAIIRTLDHEIQHFPTLFKYSYWWKRVGMMFSVGVDAQVFKWSRSADDEARKQKKTNQFLHVEMKITLEADFNHCFEACDLIVCMDSAVCHGGTITDSNGNCGTVIDPPCGDDLHGIGFYLADITNKNTRQLVSRHNACLPLRVPVVRFVPLVQRTFAEVAELSVSDTSAFADMGKKPSRKRKKA